MHVASPSRSLITRCGPRVLFIGLPFIGLIVALAFGLLGFGVGGLFALSFEISYIIFPLLSVTNVTVVLNVVLQRGDLLGLGIYLIFDFGLVSSAFDRRIAIDLDLFQDF